jgi:hypothetical protein
VSKLIIWTVLGCGMLASMFLLPGRLWLIATMGTLVGFVLPFVLNKLTGAPSVAGGPVRRTTASQGSMLRWIGAIVMAAGGFLLWKMLGEGQAEAMFELHPWLASNGVYVAALPLGLGLNMLATEFNFTQPTRER